MKKNYLKPALESIVLNVAWAVCTDLSANLDNYTETGGGASGRNMPRKPF